MDVNDVIFREYDIRGVVDRDLGEDVVEAIGRGFGTFLRRREMSSVCIGRDMRASSAPLRDALARGLLASGLDVTDLGICPTPLLYFALEHYETPGGVMITGSHDPADVNGLELCAGKAPLSAEEIQELAEIVRGEDFVSGEGTLRQAEIVDPYIAWVRGNVRIDRALKVVIDAGNGVAGLVAPALLEALGLEPTTLYCDPDPSFPNHPPDPSVAANLEALVDRVHETGADVGLAYDGDGDRLGVVTGRGRIVWGDELLLLFARDLLASRPGATVVADVRCTQRLFDDVAARGGNAIPWKVGHSRIRAKMRETGAALGGERSGHLFFADRFFGFDDGLYASVRLLEILAKTNGGVDDLLRGLPEVSGTPEIRRACPDDRKLEIVAALTERLRAEEGLEIIDLDGVRARFEDGAWALVRASNTGPALVLRFEAPSGDRLDEVRALVEDSLAEITGRS